MKTGAKLIFGDGTLRAEVVEELPGGNRLVRFNYEGIFLEVLDRLGKMPLPPYIKEELQDRERYQTVYSKEIGSAAAPTAGLHFTKELLDQIESMGVRLCYVTLHVGLGTFRPVKEENITDHLMHSEFCMISQETADVINETRKQGGRVVCVGTTSCRTVESWAEEDGTLKASAGWTNIYIYPGYRFKVLDCLITNFHLPESTLIMLVSALAGREHVLDAYRGGRGASISFFSALGTRCLLDETSPFPFYSKYGELFVFEVIKTEGKARRGVFQCAHGTVQTPVFMNVGTQAAIKGGVSALDLKEIGCQIELSNTYHLHVRPGDDTVRALGGLHKFMRWDGPIFDGQRRFPGIFPGQAAANPGGRRDICLRM